MTTNLRTYYPEINPFDSGFLKVSDLHEIYYEQSGQKEGKPVIYLHGGPGGGCSPTDRRYFDPSVYRIILMDQRGAGKSKPPAELRENTTKDLIEDIEKLRKLLKIEKWVVFGGSWGSTLSLTYAETHPSVVKALVLRGLFALTRKELLWYYQDGASMLFPEYFESFVEPIPLEERGDMMAAYYKRLTGDDEKVKMECAKRWSRWEMATSMLYVNKDLINKTESDIWCLQFARIESHYFVNKGFFEDENEIFKNLHKIQNIPGTMIQGRYDVVCPMHTAWKIHKAWPQAKFELIPDAGHSAKESGILDALIRACDSYRDL